MIRAGRFLCESDAPYRRVLTLTLAFSVTFHIVVLLLHPFAWWRPKEAPIAAMEGPDITAPEIAAV